MKPTTMSIACMLAVALLPATVFAQDQNERLNKLEESITRQQQTIEQQQKAIDALKTRATQTSHQDPLAATSAASSPKASGLFGGSAFANPNISLILDTFGYSSNLTNDELANRGIPGFTTQGVDQRKGFNLRAAELFIFSPVDPYSNLYVNLPVTENGMELEEAYIVTTALPAGWQVKLGKFKSNFSRLDAQHPHAWDFWDIALPYRAFLGGEGLGGEKGMQLTYLPAWSFYTQMGVEVLQGENDLLFGQGAKDGPHAFSFFVKSSIDTSDNSTFYAGPSALFGKTKNQNIIPGAEVAGDSALYGLEAVWKWKPASREALTIQSEYLLLTQSGDSTDLTTAAVDPLRRRQDGFYIQGIYRKDRWGVGARYDLLDIFQETFEQSGVQQNFGGRPHRETASLEYNPSEFTRVRLQLTHDRSDTVTGRTNNEAILQFNFGIGAHAAHSF
jgi:uncharacterized coiled-coil protein SlyX